MSYNLRPPGVAIGNAYANSDLGTKPATFSGSDINVMVSTTELERIANGILETHPGRLIKIGSLQTISISSRRTVDPARTLGRAMPVQYTKGPRTIAGSLIFTDINYEELARILETGWDFNNERWDGGLFIDQIKEFNIHIPCMNEHGQMAWRYVHGVTIGNYGTTYSIDNMLTESTYTYVAKWVSPLLPWDYPVTEVLKDIKSQMRLDANSRASSLARPLQFPSWTSLET